MYGHGYNGCSLLSLDRMWSWLLWNKLFNSMQISQLWKKDCQQECSECGQEKCNSTPGCLSSDVLISRGTRKIIANVIVKHFSYIDLFNFITVLL